MHESPNLFGGSIWPLDGFQRKNADKLTWDMHQPGPGGGGGGKSAGLPAGALAGSGQGLANQVPRRMKKK